MDVKVDLIRGEVSDDGLDEAEAEHSRRFGKAHRLARTLYRREMAAADVIYAPETHQRAIDWVRHRGDGGGSSSRWGEGGRVDLGGLYTVKSNRRLTIEG